MLSVPHRAQDDKFTNSIEGFRGNIHKLGRLIAHDWFSVTLGDNTKERYLFLFKTKLLVSKVRRISDERSVFQLKDIISLEQVEIKDQQSASQFELIDKIGGQSLVLTSHKDKVKEYWLKELRSLASEAPTEVSSSDDLHVISAPASPPTEPIKKKQKIIQEVESKSVSQTIVSSTSEERTVSITAIKEVLSESSASKSEFVSISTEESKEGGEIVQSVVVNKCESDLQKTEIQEGEAQAVTATESKPGDCRVISVAKLELEVEEISLPKVSENLLQIQLSTEGDISKTVKSEVEVPDKNIKRETKPEVPEKPSPIGPKSNVCQNIEEKSGLEEIKEEPVTVTSKSVQEEKVDKSGVLEASTKSRGSKKTTGIKEVKSGIHKGKDINCKEDQKELLKEDSIDKQDIKDFEPKSNLVKQKQNEKLPEKISEKKKSTSEPDSPTNITKKVVTTEEQVKVKKPGPIKVISDREPKQVAVDAAEEQDDPGKDQLLNHLQSKVADSVTSVDFKELGTSASKLETTVEPESIVSSVEVDLKSVDKDIMSRKYTSAYGTTDAYGESSSYSRSAVRKSTYSSDSGLTSTSRYGTEALTANKYGPEGGSSILAGKYGAEASITSKYGTETSAISGRFSSDSLGGSKYDEVTSKYGIRGVSGDSDSGSLSYGRKSLGLESKGDYTSKYSRGISEDSDKYGGDSASYARRSYLENKESKYEEVSSKYGRGLSTDSETGSLYTRKSYTIDAKAAVGGGDSKYEDLSAKYNRNISIESDKDTSEYYKRRNLSFDSSELESPNYSRKYAKTERKSLVDLGEDTSSYRRRNNKPGIDEEVGADEDLLMNISKRRTKSQVSTEADFDADAYISKVKSRNGNDYSDSSSSYRRRSNRGSVDEEMDTGADVYVSKRSSKSQISIEEDYDPEAYIAKAKNRNDDNDNNQSYRRTVSKEDDKEEMYKRSISENEEENRLAKFEKYSRKSSDVSEQVQTPSGKYTRTDSNSSTSHESYQTLADTSVVSGEVISQSKVEEEATISKTLKAKQNIKSEDMAPPPEKKSKKSSGTNQSKDTEDAEVKKAGFIVKLKDAELLEDTYLRFMIKVKGDPHPTLTFFKDGVKISDKDKRVSINRDHSDNDFYELVIPDVKPEDAGVYKCIAKNELGEESTEAKVTITSSKHLFDDLADKEGPLPAGEKPAFIWKRDGIEFEPEERFKVLMGDDQDSLALIFQHVKPEDAGMYTCVAQTSAGHISCSAELTVQGQVYELHREPEKPQLIIEKKEALTTTGGSCMLEMKCLGFPKPRITIKHNGTPVDAGTKYKLLYEDDENMALIIKNVEGPDAGTYEITAENELGKDVQDMHLTVKQPPKLKSKMLDTSAAANQPLKMTLEVEGIPKPTVQFFKDGKPIENSDHIKVVIDGDKYNIVIDKTNLDDSGKYSVALKNELAEVTEAWDLNVYCAPKLIRGLGENKIVELKEQVELSIQIESKPDAEITWYKDGQEISSTEHLIISKDGDTYKLKISGAISTDSASYKVKAKNIHGSVESECRVDVKRKPTITSELQNQTATEGDKNVTFNLKLDAFPKPTIKWYLDEVELLESRSEFTRYETNDGATLVIKEVNHTLSGQYTCKLLNDLGETSTSAKLTVHCKPRIIKQLKDMIIEEGATLHLEVEVDCCPEASEVKWLRNGREVSADARITITRDKQRLENYHLTVNLIKYEEQGDYEVYVTNAIGTVSSKSTVTVQTIPKILDTNMRDGLQYESLDVSYAVKGWANPPPTATWTLNGSEIKPDGNCRIGDNGEEFKLDIVKLDPKHAGLYECKLSNAVGDIKQQAKLEVIPEAELRRPKVKDGLGLTDQSVMKYKPVTFTAVIVGDPIPNVAWLLNGKEITPEDIDKHGIFLEARDVPIEHGLKETTFSLSIPRCERENGGKYTIRAKNKWGVIESNGTLTIRMAPEIDGPEYVKVIPGEPAELVCVVQANPPATVTWSKSERLITSGSHIVISEDLAKETYKLKVVSAQIADEGYYKVIAKNEYGQTETEGKIRLIRVPHAKSKRETEHETGAPMALEDPPIISRMADRHCTLSWKPSIPSGPRPPVTYILEMLEMPNGEWFTARSGIRSCVCDVGNLEPFRDYKFRIRVENQYGISDPSPYALTHREKLIPDPPRFVPYLPPGIDFRPETSPYFPRDFDIDHSPHDNMKQAPQFLRQEHSTQYGVKDQNCNLFWFVYGYPKPTMQYYFNDELIESGGRFDFSYTRNGQATLFINKMLERDVGFYEAIATNEHGTARQRVRLEIAELPTFIKRPDIEYVMVRNQAKFQARILGVPYPEVKWYKDWKPLASSARIKIQFIEPDLHVLTISDSIYKDEGLYSVSARNVAGSTSASAMLYVDENDLDYNLHTYKPCNPVRLKKRPLIDGYDLGDELGRGTQGVTYHAVERNNGHNYAAKIMHGRGDLKPLMHNELDILNQLRHRKLISLHDSYEHEDQLALILELAAGGELVRDYLLKRDYYTESDIAGYIKQILQGLDYMHSNGFAHMGLDIGDLLLSHPGSDNLKITDFSLSRRITMGHLAPLKFGMPEYVSPECAKGEGVGLGHDMWSVGVITYILLSGFSPFRGGNDMETLQKIQSGLWTFDETWWGKLSIECRDFITKLLVYQSDGRMDVHSALRHPWLDRSDKIRSEEYRISTKYLRDYYSLYREWYEVANCRLWFRRKALECAFNHPSKMIYIPGERFTPPPNEGRERKPFTWEEKIPSRSPLNYEIGMFKSESHYQNGPDTYLLQLRDVDFPCRLREYMKVAASRGPGYSYILSDENGYDWRTPIIRERRRFTDIMDEEIDDERKSRINRYGTGNSSHTIRRLRHEVGTRLDTYAEAEAFLESKMDGRLPFFREKPQLAAMQEGREVRLSCLAVGEPKPVVQWFKNDAIIAESSRIRIETDDIGRSHITLSPALGFDLGMYKVVARNKIGQTIARTRIVYGTVSDPPESPIASQISSNEVLLTWKQPRNDGHAPIICYSLQYKLADGPEWVNQAKNIDHEFYYMRGLAGGQNYVFRLAARNAMGWSDDGEASGGILTHPGGAAKVQLSQAMMHLQQITDSGVETQVETQTMLDYEVEITPIEWIQANVQDHFSFVSELARGKFSTVTKAIDNKTDTLVVIKTIDVAALTEDLLEGEFAAIRSLRHERIASLLAAYRSNNTVSFVLEKLQGADVLAYLASRQEYTEQTVATIVSQVLDGLQYLHWRGLCHLDLQPDNIVMCGMRSVQVKLVDFGCAHRVTKLGNSVPVVGHPDYICPEILAEEAAFPQSDIWSIGVLTYVMLSGTLPFRGTDENETRQNILFVRYRFEHLYKEVSQEGVRFVMLLFKRHANKRPTAEECHENRWLLPTDHMIKKRERAVFFGTKLKEYSEEYHAEKAKNALTKTSALAGKNVLRSQNVQEELQTETA